MIYSLTWLPSVLEAAGLKVAPLKGWESRGHSEMGDVLGILCHHTVGPKKGNMPSLNVLRDGRSDLPGPLAQLGLGRDGTYYVIAAGKCSHAGKGNWKGLTLGNTNFIGIEAENTGGADDFPWPDIQMDAYARGVAAILKHLNRSVDFCAGHKEYALPAGRKPDPTFDMNAFRAAVATFLDGSAPVKPLIPAADPANPARLTVRRGDAGELVKVLQTKLALPVLDGIFGPKTEAAVRVFQRDHGLVPDGIVGPKTWAVLEA